MIDAANPVLREAPEAFNRIRMSIPGDVDPLRMIDALDAVAPAWRRLFCSAGFVREDHVARYHARADLRQHVAAITTLELLLANASVTLYHARYGPFPMSAVPAALVLVLVASFPRKSFHRSPPCRDS